MCDATLSLDDAPDIWLLVERQLDAFCQAWDQAPPVPSLADFVQHDNLTLRKLLLTELIKVDLEHRWSDPALVQSIDTYLDQWTELVRDGVVPAELLYEEIYQRRQHGEEVDANEYLQKYPQAAHALRRLIGIDAAEVSTALSHSRLEKEYSVGDRVDDFELRAELGRGAFAVVFLAIQRSMQRMVALKISANKGTEAQVLCQLDHPNIVRVYDRRVLDDEDLQLFYMQYVRGGTLQEALRYVQEHPSSVWHGALVLESIQKSLSDRGEVLPPSNPSREARSQLNWIEMTCEVGRQLASALDYAHEHNVLHRDIKPANILLTEDGVPMLADFNISCCSKLDGASPAAYFGGSLAYMSPEQLEAYNPLHPREPDTLDGRSDMYSTGIVIWEMLTGSRPFGDERLAANWESTLAEMTERRRRGLTEAEFQQLPACCPPALRTFFERCLHPTPDERFPAAADMTRPLRIAGSRAMQELVTGRQRWVGWARRHPLLFTLAGSVIPNGFAGSFVYNYNREVAKFGDAFWYVQFILNAIFFPLGIGLVLYWIWPVVIALRARRNQQPPDRRQDDRARETCLTLGRNVALLGICEWIIAALCFPIVMHIVGVDLSLRNAVDLFGSNTLGGLIAGTYPLLLLTYIGLAAWYPTFLESGYDDRREMRQLATVTQTASVAEIVAGALPMLAVVLLVTWGDSQDNRSSLTQLSIASLIGFGVLFWISRRIRHVVDIFLDVLRPADEKL